MIMFMYICMDISISISISIYIYIYAIYVPKSMHLKSSQCGLVAHVHHLRRSSRGDPFRFASFTPIGGE